MPAATPITRCFRLILIGEDGSGTQNLSQEVLGGS
jgi:hypothetical protein